MTPEEIEADVAAIDTWIGDYESVAERKARLCLNRAWEHYGLDSWDALCRERGWNRPLTLEQRQQEVAALRQQGMSTRAIAAAVGASKSQVDRDLATVPNGTVDEVVSLDGRTRPATRPEVITAEEFVADYLSDDEVMAVLDQVVPEQPEHLGDNLSTLAFRASYSRAIARAHGVTAFCAGEHVEKFDEEMRDELTSLIDSLRRRAERIDAHLKAKTPRLRVIGETQ